MCPLGRLPNTVDINNTRYALYCMTYGNGTHFTGSVNIPDMGWHFYNGLDVYHNSRPGIKKVVTQNSPLHYRRNCCLYISCLST